MHDINLGRFSVKNILYRPLILSSYSRLHYMCLGHAINYLPFVDQEKSTSAYTGWPIYVFLLDVSFHNIRMDAFKGRNASAFRL